jgi:alanine racemase
MVRVGILLSGHLPAPHLGEKIELKRALTLRSRLARVFTAVEGDTVGYGRTWTASRPSVIGLVPLGYGDGYRRAISNRGVVLVRGMRCPVIGLVSMDQLGVDLSGVPDVAESDEVVLIGRQGTAEITAEEVADWTGTISYEVLCGLAARVPRLYYHSGEPVEVCDLLGCGPVRERKRARKELNR